MDVAYGVHGGTRNRERREAEILTMASAASTAAMAAGVAARAKRSLDAASRFYAALKSIQRDLGIVEDALKRYGSYGLRDNTLYYEVDSTTLMWQYLEVELPADVEAQLRLVGDQLHAAAMILDREGGAQELAGALEAFLVGYYTYLQGRYGS